VKPIRQPGQHVAIGLGAQPGRIASGGDGQPHQLGIRETHNLLPWIDLVQPLGDLVVKFRRFEDQTTFGG
jgi:hypothetical protein